MLLNRSFAPIFPPDSFDRIPLGIQGQVGVLRLLGHHGVRLPAGLLVKVAKGFASTATLEKDGKSCDLRKLMALMGMGVKQGDTVTVKVEGDDEAAAAEAIQKFLTENV